MTCRTDLFRPDIVSAEAFPDECPDCLDIQTAERPDLSLVLTEHRARMHAVAVQLHAACG